MTLTSSIQLALTASLVGANDFATPSYTLNYRKTTSLASGTAAQQADRIFADQRTVALSSNEDLDLAGVLLDPFGNTLTFVKIKALLLYAATANTNNVLIAPGSATPFLGWFADASDITAVKPGGIFLITAPGAGWTVGAGATDKINIANSGAGTGVTYDLVVLGTSA
jgi:hypothetical protein